MEFAYNRDLCGAIASMLAGVDGGKDDNQGKTAAGIFCNNYWTFANWAFKSPNAQFVKITILAAQGFSIFAKWRLAV
jgi:hypothetical protein